MICMLVDFTVMNHLLSNSGVSLERLQSFLHVAEAGGIARACGGDPVKQSQYSRQIRELEAFFGTALTLRQGRRVVISAQGLRLAEVIRQNFQSLEDFRREMADAPRVFSLGAGGSVLEWTVAPMFGRLFSIWPDSTWKLENHRSADLVSRVADGRLDFAIVRSDAIPPGLPALKVTVQSYVAALPRQWAADFADQTRLTLKHLAALRLALPTERGQMRDAVEAVFAKAGLKLNPSVTCGGSLQAHALVASGSCAAILPDSIPSDGISTYAIPQMAGYRRTLVLHWNERQMERRAISGEKIRAMARLLQSVKTPAPRADTASAGSAR